MATALMALVLTLNFLCASNCSHKAIHNDADSATHECAITLFSHGNVEAAFVPVRLPTPSFILIKSSERANTPWYARFADFSFTRGPPAFCC